MSWQSFQFILTTYSPACQKKITVHACSQTFFCVCSYCMCLFSLPHIAKNPLLPTPSYSRRERKQWSRAEQWLPPWCGGVVYLFEARACPTCFPSDPPTVTDGATTPRGGSTLQHDLSVSGTLANGCCAVVHHSNGLGDVNDRAEAWAYLCMYAHADAPRRYKCDTVKFQQRMNHFRVFTYSLLQLQCSCRTRKDFVFFCLFVCYFRLCVFAKFCVSATLRCAKNCYTISHPAVASSKLLYFVVMCIW